MKNESKRWFLRVAGDNPNAATMEIHAGDPTDLLGIRRIAVISQPAGEPLIPANERLRNAHLIAAAPNLLGACKTARITCMEAIETLRAAPCTSPYCYGGTCHRCAGVRQAQKILKAAESAIAKAEGRSE